MPRPERRADRRRFELWDLAGLALAASVALAVWWVAVALLHTPLGRSHVVRAESVAWWAMTAAGVMLLSIRAGINPRRIGRRLVAVWRDPPGHWVAFALGVIVALPLLAVYAPALFPDSDSARLVAGVMHVQHHGIGYLRDTQDNLLPHLVLGPALALGGLPAAKLTAIGTTALCTGTVSYLTRRITGSMAGAFVAAIAFLAFEPVVSQAGLLPMYPAMLTLGYLGGWLAYRALAGDDHGVRLALAGGLCLALAPEAQAIGVLFAPVPVVLAACFGRRLRSSVKALAVLYGTAAALSIPRLILNLSEGGFSHVLGYRTDYWVTHGYLADVQTHFFRYVGSDESYARYLRHLPARFIDGLGPWGWTLLAAGVLSWLLVSSGRVRLFGVIVSLYFFAAVVAKEIPPFARYFSPLWPALAISIGAGAARLAKRHDLRLRTVTAALTGGLVLLAATNFVSVERSDQHGYSSLRQVRDLVGQITNDQGVIGSRVTEVLYVKPDIPTWGGQFLTADEYATYLIWPSDQAVIRVLRRHDIGWVLIGRNNLLENEYHDTWLVPRYGRHSHHVVRIAESPNFCRRAVVGGRTLYQLGHC